MINSNETTDRIFKRGNMRRDSKESMRFLIVIAILFRQSGTMNQKRNYSCLKLKKSTVFPVVFHIFNSSCNYIRHLRFRIVSNRHLEGL